jgi:hypothetical protein
VNQQSLKYQFRPPEKRRDKDYLASLCAIAIDFRGYACGCLLCATSSIFTPTTYWFQCGPKVRLLVDLLAIPETTLNCIMDSLAAENKAPCVLLVPDGALIEPRPSCAISLYGTCRLSEKPPGQWFQVAFLEGTYADQLMPYAKVGVFIKEVAHAFLPQLSRAGLGNCRFELPS